MKKLFIILLLAFPLLAKAQYISTAAGNGVAGFGGDGGWCLLAKLDDPGTIGFDGAGNLYITDVQNNRVRKVNTLGVITTIAGNGISGFSGDNGPATLAQLNGIQSIAVDAAGNVFIAEWGDHRIRKVNTTGIISTIAGTGTSGYNGDGIPAISAKLNYPTLGTVDNVGNVFFSDYNNSRVRKINTSGIISTVAGCGLIGDSGDGGPATAAKLGGPTYLYVRPSGEIYIPDNIHSRIRKVGLDGVITAFAGGGVSTSDGIPATAAYFGGTLSIAFDDSGNAFIPDPTYNKIRKVNTSGIITTVAGTGGAGYAGDGGPATAAMLNFPACVTWHSADQCLYITDNHNNRIRKFSYTPVVVNEVKSSPHRFSIYPNPAREQITIGSDVGIENVSIVNTVGLIVVKDNTVSGKESSLSVRDLSPGIYFVRVNGVYAGRFVKE